jgi:hypothetical protein
VLPICDLLLGEGGTYLESGKRGKFSGSGIGFERGIAGESERAGEGNETGAGGVGERPAPEGLRERGPAE